ncbi:hypothetical protein HY489_00200 [Candidatus Woesearchaeota archaeon]|nr:hypothetical protein [Candidatus Woesearchaeota archaeon]
MPAPFTDEELQAADVLEDTTKEIESLDLEKMQAGMDAYLVHGQPPDVRPLLQKERAMAEKAFELFKSLKSRFEAVNADGKAVMAFCRCRRGPEGVWVCDMDRDKRIRDAANKLSEFKLALYGFFNKLQAASRLHVGENELWRGQYKWSLGRRSELEELHWGVFGLSVWKNTAIFQRVA